jgi:hypothetical protein
MSPPAVTVLPSGGGFVGVIGIVWKTLLRMLEITRDCMSCKLEGYFDTTPFKLPAISEDKSAKTTGRLKIPGAIR